jgi:hypothetical protein
LESNFVLGLSEPNSYFATLYIPLHSFRWENAFCKSLKAVGKSLSESHGPLKSLMNPRSVERVEVQSLIDFVGVGVGVDVGVGVGVDVGVGVGVGVGGGSGGGGGGGGGTAQKIQN